MSMPTDPIGQIKAIIIAVVAVVLFSVIGYLGYTKSLLETKVAEQQNDITALQDQNQNFTRSVAEANAALAAIKKDADDRAAMAQKAVEEAHKQSQVLTAQAMALQVIKPVGDDCAATKSFLSHYFGGKP